MGYVLKSDIEVNDPDGKFEYYSEYGVATKSLYDFVNNLKESGSDISDSEFAALKTFETDAKNLGVWNNIKEIIPLMGGTPESVAVKYKGLHTLEMTPVNTPSAGRVNSKGLTYPTWSGGPTSGYNSNFKLQDILDIGGLGIIYYAKSLAGETASNRTIIGGSGKVGNPTGSQITSNGSNANSNIFNATNPALFVDKNAPLLIMTTGVINAGVLSGRATFDNGSLIFESASTVTLDHATHDLTKELYVGINNNNGSPNQSFLGDIRLLMITDGRISRSLIPQVNTLLDSLITGLGKEF